VQTSAHRVMASIFWDSEGSLLVEFLQRGATFTSEWYVQTLKKLKQWIWRVWLKRKMNQVLVHDITRPHTSLHTREAVATMGWWWWWWWWLAFGFEP